MTDRHVERDRTTIRDMVESWVVWRDSGQWDALATIFHEDGVMMTTWTQAVGSAFVEASRAAWARGLDVQHQLGGSAIQLVGDRAIAQTKVTISQRAEVHGVLVDVACQGRFYDLFERRGTRWGILLRQPTYERDRMDAVAPGARLELDPNLLAEFPQGYRHLAYLQSQSGMTVRRDMPGRTGPALERLYVKGEAWLAGAAGHPASEDFGAS